MCLRVVCVLGLGVGYDDRVWLEGLSLVPRVRGVVVEVIYQIGVVCVVVCSGPGESVRELVLMGEVAVRVRRL